MKSSKIEKILDYNPPLEDPKTLSPFTYYQPFQSSFDPEFSVHPPKPSVWSNNPPINRWNQNPERPIGGPATPGGLLTPWDLTRSPPQSSDSFSGASTSGWGEPEGRSLCNSTWRTPVGPKPSYSGYEDSQTSKSFLPNTGGLNMYSSFTPNSEGGFGGFGSGTSFPSKWGYTHSTRHINFDENLTHSSYYPLMLGSSGKNNINQNFFKTGHSRPMMCNFCKNNKEVPDIYLNHYLYDPETKILSCPVLRKHVCEICGGTGDQAHTLQYCPINRERGLQSKVPVLLKTRTITNSTGKIRRN